jgi:hypothetical protein
MTTNKVITFTKKNRKEKKTKKGYEAKKKLSASNFLLKLAYTPLTHLQGGAKH